MAMRITCVKKSAGFHQDPHHAIESVGWVNEETGERNTSTRLQVYDWIKNQNGRAYVTDRVATPTPSGHLRLATASTRGL